MTVKQQLLETLQDLGDEELKHLQNAELVDGFTAIKKYRLEKADRLKTMDLMVGCTLLKML